MRLFVAVEVGEAIATDANGVVETLRMRASSLAPAARVTWVTREQMHLTVRFIGHVDDGQAARIEEALRPPLSTDPFDVTVEGVGAFPPRGAPRVIWAGLTNGADGLAGVEREVTSRLASVGIAAENRPYRPHLTLGRVKVHTGLRTAALLDGVNGHTFGHVRVAAITLFESRLSPKGPTYVPIMHTRLGGRS